jgi:hypothetical protein
MTRWNWWLACGLMAAVAATAVAREPRRTAGPCDSQVPPEPTPISPDNPPMQAERYAVEKHIEGNLGPARGDLNRRTSQVGDLVWPRGLKDAFALPPRLGESSEDRLIRLITSTIAPQTWSDMGGQGTIQYSPLTKTLIVNQTEDVQEQIAGLLAELRRLEEQYPILCLETKVVEVGREGRERVSSSPKLTFRMEMPAVVSQAAPLLLRTGTIHDVLASSPPPTETNGQAFILTRGGEPTSAEQVERRETEPLADPAPVGTILHIKASKLPQTDFVRLDLAVQISEVEEANKERIVLTGKTYRMVQRAHLGTPFRLVLERFRTGEPRKWMEFTVSDPREK